MEAKKFKVIIVEDVKLELKGKEEMILQYIKEHKTKVYISKKLGVNRQTLREFLKTHPEIPRKWKRIQKD